MRVKAYATAAAFLLHLAGCRGLNNEDEVRHFGVRHLGATRVIHLGGTVSAPKNPALKVRFLADSEGAKSGLFEVSHKNDSYRGWAAEGESLGRFARAIVGNSGVVLIKLAPDEATVMFRWAEPY